MIQIIEILKKAAKESGTTIDEIVSQDRGTLKACAGRKQAAYLLYEKLGLTPTEIASAFGRRDPSGIIKMINEIRDNNEN